MQGYVASVWGVAVGRRPDPGRGLLRVPELALDLLRQPAARRRSPPGCCARHFHEQVERRQHRIDFAGAVLLTAGCSLVILGLLEGGVAWGWGSPTELRDLRRRCRRARRLRAGRAAGAEPVLPLWVFSRRVLLGGNLAAVAIGVVADRPELLRADVRPGRAGHRRAGRRVRAGRDDGRLADRGGAVRPALPAHRLPATRR